MNHSKSRAEFVSLLEPYLSYDSIQVMRHLPHHHGISLYDHSVHVAWYAMQIANAFHMRAKHAELIQAALLHDYFLYDRMDQGKRCYHGFRHPPIAAEKAYEDFQVSDEVYMAIVTHMWPEVPWEIPLNRIGWIICLADKIAAVQEYLGRKHFPADDCLDDIEKAG